MIHAHASCPFPHSPSMRCRLRLQVWTVSLLLSTAGATNGCCFGGTSQGTPGNPTGVARSDQPTARTAPPPAQFAPPTLPDPSTPATPTGSDQVTPVISASTPPVNLTGTMGDTCATAIAIVPPYRGEGLIDGAANDVADVIRQTNYAWTGADRFYAIPAEANQEIDIRVDDHSTFDSGFYVIRDCADPANSAIAGTDASPSSPALRVRIPQAGTYYLVVDAYDGANHGRYSLSIDQVATPTPTPGSRIPAEIVSTAVDPSWLDRELREHAWVFFPHGVRSCDHDSGPEFMPPGNNEFERRTAEQTREGIRQRLQGQVVRFEGSGVIAAADDEVSLGGRGGPFLLSRSAYNFSRSEFTFHVMADSDLSPSAMLASVDGANWALCMRGTCSPEIRPETYEQEVMRSVGRLDGRDLELRGVASDTEWHNFSRIAIRAPMDAESAARFASSMPVSFVMYLRFAGLGHHQRCHQSCDVMFGQRICSGEDTGMGVFKRTELLAFELRVGGALVADYVR